MRKIWNRWLKRPDWHNLRNTRPISKVFGLDRGLPIDRYYIERFLQRHQDRIRGAALEVGEDTYTKRFGNEVRTSDVLHVDPSNKKATVVGDLAVPDSLPDARFDCFVCTQTLNFILDVKNAVRGMHKLLRPGGTVLATVAGLCQISRYDMDRWGDFWRFTTKSAESLFGEVFGQENVTVRSDGNVLAAVALLEGLAASELTPAELDHHDPDYQIVITILARKS